jgi:hypothetical protein
MNELKALEKIITAGYSVTSNFNEVARFFATRKDVKVKDILGFFKNTYCRKNEIGQHRMDLKFFKGTIAGQSAMLFSKWVKERYLENWTLKVSPQGVKELKAIKKVAEEKRDILKAKRELLIQERIDEAVAKALSTNIVKTIAEIEVENNKFDKVEKTTVIRRKEKLVSPMKIALKKVI